MLLLTGKDGPCRTAGMNRGANGIASNSVFMFQGGNPHPGYPDIIPTKKSASGARAAVFHAGLPHGNPLAG